MILYVVSSVFWKICEEEASWYEFEDIWVEVDGILKRRASHFVLHTHTHTHTRLHIHVR